MRFNIFYWHKWQVDFISLKRYPHFYVSYFFYNTFNYPYWTEQRTESFCCSVNFFFGSNHRAVTPWLFLQDVLQSLNKLYISSSTPYFFQSALQFDLFSCGNSKCINFCHGFIICSRQFSVFWKKELPQFYGFQVLQR